MPDGEFAGTNVADAVLVNGTSDTTLAPVLIYPIGQGCQSVPVTAESGRRSLAALMGGTRAAVLYTVGAGATTTQLAHRLNTSLASVSRHTGVLRNAGLISTHRQGSSVVHALTDLGSALLEHHQSG